MSASSSILMPRHASVDLAWRGHNLVGECPVWDDARQALWWTDIEGRALHRLDPATGAHVRQSTAARVGCFALGAGSEMIAAAEHRFAWLDADSGELESLLEVEGDRPGNRFNDGGCDRQGRFLAGSMNLARDAATASLWSLAPDLSAREILRDATVSNGLAFTPDGRTMWWADSPRERLVRFDYDPASGEVGAVRVELDVGHAPGRPDGGTVDADGCYWSARWRGGCVVRFTPRGDVDRVVVLPVEQVTMCTFGGADFRTLFVTTARNRLDDGELARQPLAGSVFALDAGAQGVAPARFASRCLAAAIAPT